MEKDIVDGETANFVEQHTMDNAVNVEFYRKFERLEYEALADKKRKAVAACQSEGESSKKARLDDPSLASMEEMMEAMNCGFRRRKSRKIFRISKRAIWLFIHAGADLKTLFLQNSLNASSWKTRNTSYVDSGGDYSEVIIKLTCVCKMKKKGRRKGTRNKVSPEILRMLGEATLNYARGSYEEAISILNEVVMVAPNLPDSYHTLGLVHDALGNKKRATDFYMIAAHLNPKDSSLWQLLIASLEQGDPGLVEYCLSKAIKADPSDRILITHQATLFINIGDYMRAAEAYENFLRFCPHDKEALTECAKLYLKCGQIEHSIRVLENYLKDHPSGVNLSIIELLASIFMENNAHDRALELIEDGYPLYFPGEELPLNLKVEAGICYIHLGDTRKAEVLFSVFQSKDLRENLNKHIGLIAKFADAYMDLKHFRTALKNYHMLETDAAVNNGFLYLKIAQCYLSLNEKAQAITYFYKALQTLKNNIDARLTLASLLLEDDEEHEAISLLSPPKDTGITSENHKPWWLDERIKMKIYFIYKAKGMPEDFVDSIYPLVRESLHIESLQQKVKVKKRLSKAEILERAKVLDDRQTDNVFSGFRPLAPKHARMKAKRAKKLLMKRATQKEEKKANAIAAGFDWQSDDSDDEPREQEVIKESPLPNLLKDEEHHCLIIDLCKALASLRRFEDASEIINLALKSAYNVLSTEKMEELRSLGAQMAYHSKDSKHGFDYVRYIVIQHPYSFAAWNMYYKVTARLGKSYPKHSKFMRIMRAKFKDCVPPIIIAGHQFTGGSFHQDAARDYLEAYKLLPESPLINLCAGSSLINLALGFRLQNKHQCVAQGLAFLHNNLRICENSQEAVYNMARAFHQVGLVSLAASYYEKVLQMGEKDYPIPRLPNELTDLTENKKSGYCDLKREAAFNLHLIYKKSGATDLARQVLKEHCTF
ncbi:hypothetical protein ACFE04_012781 [Oxalis oulophora]